MTAASRISIRPISVAEAEERRSDFSLLLHDAVASGAAVNFMAGFSLQDANTFWQKQIAAFASNDRIWLIAEEAGKTVGMVMCLFFSQPNQPFRGEIAKMLVLRSHRGRGIGAMLMAAIEQEALKAGKTHLLLDTATGSAGDRLYRRMGWTELGTLRNMGYYPDGRLSDATLFFKELAPAPEWTGQKPPTS